MILQKNSDSLTVSEGWFCRIYNDHPFNAGMKNRFTVLGDIEKDDPKNWVEPFNSKYSLIDGVLRSRCG